MKTLITALVLTLGASAVAGDFDALQNLADKWSQPSYTGPAQIPARPYQDSWQGFYGTLQQNQPEEKHCFTVPTFDAFGNYRKKIVCE